MPFEVYKIKYTNYSFSDLIKAFTWKFKKIDQCLLTCNIFSIFMSLVNEK